MQECLVRTGGCLSRGGAKAKPKGGSVVRASGGSVGGEAVGGAKLKVSQEGVARVPGGDFDRMSWNKAVVYRDRRVCKSVVRGGVSAKFSGLVRVGLGRSWGSNREGVW